MYKIATLNAISDIIFSRLSADLYTVTSANEPVPDAVLVRSADMLKAVLPDSLLAIARAGAGTNNIPIADCTRKGIVVFNTPGANANAVAELCLCGMLIASRNVVGGIEWARTLAGQADVAKLVEKGKAQFVGPELHGKTLAVIGLGAVGARVANAAANGFGMRVVGYDPFISVEHAWSLSRAIHRAQSQEEAIAQADYISIHVPLTDETRGSWNDALYAQVKPGARLMNFSRAELADADATARALASGRLAAYVCDFPTEQSQRIPGAILIPHLGASTPESEENCAVMAAEQLHEYLAFGNIRNSVNMPEIVLGHPEGSRVQIIHENAPGLVSEIAAAMSRRGINIINMLNKSRKDIAVTVLEINRAPEETLVSELNALDRVIRVRVFG